ncbi:MAG: extracellular solute-binding protein, partial [Desulfotignum sp.]
IQLWHGLGGALGEKVGEIADSFNASQDDYTVVPTYKGTYTENMTAAIAAFRAGEQPHVVQVFEVGTATMMAAEGAIRRVQGVMEQAVMWYNRDLLNEAGVEDVPQTWDEMFAAADKLQENGHDCAFSFGWQSWVMIENYLAWHDQPIGTQENGFAGLDTEFVFDESEDLTNL